MTDITADIDRTFRNVLEQWDPVRWIDGSKVIAREITAENFHLILDRISPTTEQKELHLALITLDNRHDSLIKQLKRKEIETQVYDRLISILKESNNQSIRAATSEVIYGICFHLNAIPIPVLQKLHRISPDENPEVQTQLQYVFNFFG